MSRKIISCSACNARFDVSKFPPGSRVRCGRCSQVLTVPVEDGSGGVPPSGAVNPRTSVSGLAGISRPAAPFVEPQRTAVSAPLSRSSGAGPASSMAAPSPARDPATVTAAIGAPGIERDPLLGAVLHGQYRILRKLGEGGYGAVYEAKDVHLERRVAIKIMLQSRAQSREYVAKFLREARTAAQLSHPNVVAVHGVGYDREHNVHFLAMEFVEGRTLHDVVQEKGQLPVEEAIEYIIQSCRGLQAAHERNIIHRDIKPGNLMITPAGVIKITDFGLAKVYDEGAAQSTVIGTPYFMPPEQFEGKARDGRTDIYALGVSFYYMLTLQRPHQGAGPAQILLSVMTKEAPSILEHRKDLPQGLWPIVRRMIHRDVDQRYANCDEIASDLQNLLGGGAEEKERLYCPACGGPNDVAANKCSGCGESLQEKCPVCNTVDAAGTKFCGDCGANIPLERAVLALIEEAQALLASGRLPRAKEKIAQAQERSPQNARVVQLLHDLEVRRERRDAHRDAIRELLASGRPKDASARLDVARSEFPESPEIQELEGDVRSAMAARETTQSPADDALANSRRLMKAGKLREALAAWRAVLVLAPGNEEAAAGEARASEIVNRCDALVAEASDHMLRGDPEGARDRLAEAARAIPADPVIAGRMRECERAVAEIDAELAGAEAEMAKGASAAAATRLRGLAGRFPGSEKARSALGRAETAGRAASAGVARDRLARAQTSARSHEQARRLRDAAAAWREVLDIDRDNAEASEGIARSQRGLAEYEAMLGQSKSLLQSGDPEGAIAVAESALQKVSGDPLGAGHVARARTSLETLKHETERIRKALQSEPDEEVLHWARDVAHRFSGSALAGDVLREAEEACKAAVEKAAEGKARSLLDRAKKLEADGQLERAAQVFEEILQASPNLADAKKSAERLRQRLADASQRSTEAQSKLEAGDPDGARALAEESLRLVPDQAKPAGVLAAARAALSEIERLAESLDVSDRLSPSAAEAQIERVRRLHAKFPGAARCAELEQKAIAARDAATAQAARRKVQDRLDRAKASLDAGKLSDAEAVAREALTLAPGDQLAQDVVAAVASRRSAGVEALARGREAAAAGRSEVAIAAFEAALAADPSLAEASAERDGVRQTMERRQEQVRRASAEAQEHEKAKRMREALAAWEGVLAIEAEHPRAAAEAERLRAWITRADRTLASVRTALAEGDPEAAVAAAQEARTSIGAYADADALLAAARAAQEEVERGLRDIDRGLAAVDTDLTPVVAAAEALAKRHPGSIRARDTAVRAAETAKARGREMALARVRRLVRDHKHREAMDLVAELRSQGVASPDLDVAEQHAKRVFEEVGSLRAKISAARAHGRLDEARDLFGQVLALLPGDRETKEAQASLEEAVREFSARMDLAETARRRGSLSDAIEAYREALAINQGAADVAQRIEEAEGLKSRREELRRACEAALKQGDGDACSIRAKELVTLFPDDDDARDLATTGEALKNVVTGLLSYARRQRAAGDKASAKVTLETLLRVAPDHAEARALLKA